MKNVSKASVLLMLPLMAFPYLLIVAHASIFLSTKVSFIGYFYDEILGGNGLLMLPILLAYALCCLVCAVIFTVICAKRRVSAGSLAKTMLILKIAMLPGYALNALAALVMFITIFTIPFSIIIAFFDGIIIDIFLVPTLYLLIAGVKQGRLKKGEAVVLGALQVIPFADFASAVALFVLLKKREKAAIVSDGTPADHDEGEPLEAELSEPAEPADSDAKPSEPSDAEPMAAESVSEGFQGTF